MTDKRDILIDCQEWLSSQQGLSTNTSSSYKSYLKNIPLSKICEALSNIKESDETDNTEYKKEVRVNKVLESLKSDEAGTSEKLVNSVVCLAESGDLLYARTIVDVMCDAVKKFKTNGALDSTLTESERKALRNGTPALKKFRKYLAEVLDFGYTSTIVDSGNDMSIKKSISKETLSKIDSFDGLLLEFEKKRDGEADFIRFAVEQSFFFSPKIVEDRMKKVVQLFSKEERIKEEILKGKLPQEELLFARKTTDGSKKYGDYKKDERTKRVTGCFVDKGLKIPITIDTDGNKEVRRLINDYTGYTIGIGKKSIFHNFIISHLWGQAYDPRYFTNFWNIAIIPAWVNSLLDKDVDDEDDDSLIKRLKDTFMNVSKALYEQSYMAEDWAKLHMEEPNVGSTGEVVKQDDPYKVRILCPKENNDVLGAIKLCFYSNDGNKGGISFPSK